MNVINNTIFNKIIKKRNKIILIFKSYTIYSFFIYLIALPSKENENYIFALVIKNIILLFIIIVYFLKGESKFPTDRNCAVFVHPFG